MSGFTSVRAIFLYYLASSVFLFWHPDFILKDILVAPMYFVMPAGIGLFLISLNGLHARLAATYSRPQLVLSSVFLGLISVTLLYQELERTRLLLSAFPHLYPALLLLSLVGHYRCRELISVNREAAIRVVRALSWLLPVAAVSYYFVFIHFSSYPLHDVFQRTLFMKAALELSRTGIFNVYVSGSYPPIIGVMLAHLHHFYGFDLLRGQWILPAYAWLFHMACYAVFISAFVRDKSVRKLSLVLIAALAPVFYLENMILLESATLVFLAMLVRTSAGESSWRPAMALTFWLSLLFLCYYFLFNYAYSPPATEPNLSPPRYLGLWLLMLVGMYATTAFGQKAVSNAVFLSVIAVSMFLVHRGTLLFFPMVLLVYAIYVLIFRKRIFPSPESKLRLATYLVIGLALFGGAVLVLNALTYFSIIKRRYVRRKAAHGHRRKCSQDRHPGGKRDRFLSLAGRVPPHGPALAASDRRQFADLLSCPCACRDLGPDDNRIRPRRACCRAGLPQRSAVSDNCYFAAAGCCVEHGTLRVPWSFLSRGVARVAAGISVQVLHDA